jgi:hypothetical protein
MDWPERNGVRENDNEAWRRSNLGKRFAQLVEDSDS